MTFISISELAPILDQYGLTDELIQHAIDEKFLPVYINNGDTLIWESDLISVPISWSNISSPEKLPLEQNEDNIDDKRFQWIEIRYQNGISITLPPQEYRKNISGLMPALRQLARQKSESNNFSKKNIKLADDIYVNVNTREQFETVSCIATRLALVTHDHASELTKSAYYMGSKYSLSSFLVEGIAAFLPKNGVVVDLMCGAGSATRAFSLNWEVMANDAMAFCSCLASSFGHKDNTKNILSVLPTLHLNYHQNLDQIENSISELLESEDNFLHSNLSYNEGLKEQYAKFIEHTPLYPEGGKFSKWDPIYEVLRRKEYGDNSDDTPYCLTLAYFANVYFGLRQAIELDSIRFAIDQIPDERMRNTALAALIATASYIGTGYAAQFAQPVNVRNLSEKSFFKLIEKRSIRVLPEFVARLTALAEIVSDAHHSVISSVATWEAALEKVPSFSKNRPTCIYIDAPYTRDEYARYYHVLETLCKYHYPDSIGKGRTPDRKKDQIFKSPFFTRKSDAIPPLLSRIITASLQKAEYCAWSYSSRAIASIPEVVRLVNEQGGELLESFSTSHQYRNQGRTDKRVNPSDSVIEYLLIFRRR